MVRLSRSIYEEAEEEVREHKWRESEKAGRDLGVEAVRGWTKSYWLRFYRWRFVQHLRGEVCWREFDFGCFGIVCGRLSAHGELLEVIMDRVRDGAENLDILVWTHECGLPVDQVMDILEALDINSRRLAPPGWR